MVEPDEIEINDFEHAAVRPDGAGAIVVQW